MNNTQSPKSPKLAKIIIKTFPDCWKSFQRGDSYLEISRKIKEMKGNFVDYSIETIRRSFDAAYFGFHETIKNKEKKINGIFDNAKIDSEKIYKKRKQAQNLQDRLHYVTGAEGWTLEDEEELIRLYTQGFGVGLTPIQISQIKVPNRTYTAISNKLDSLRKEEKIKKQRIDWEIIGPFCDKLFEKKRKKEINASYVAKVLNRALYGGNNIITRSKINNYKKRKKEINAV